jgi:hypothetical protein
MPLMRDVKRFVRKCLELTLFFGKNFFKLSAGYLLLIQSGTGKLIVGRGQLHGRRQNVQD